MIKRNPPGINARLRLDQRGTLLGASVIIMIVFSIIGLALVTYVTGQYSITNRSVFTANALLVAEAGIEDSMYRLNQSDDYPGTTEAQGFFDNEHQGRGTFETVVENLPDSNARMLISTGRVYHPGTGKLVNSRTVKVTIVGTGSEGFSVHTGPGGLIMGGSAKITNSDVFVNGRIQMTGAASIGTSAQAANVRVAHQSCPAGSNPGASYPQVCDTGQPISLQWSTFIYGTVCATGQTTHGPDPSHNIKPVLPNDPGLILGCNAPPVQTPSYNRAAHIASMTTTGSGNSNTYTCQSWPFDRTWPANLRLTGNVNIESSCNLTINGNVYIEGNLTIAGAATVRVSNSVGTNRPVFVVDGNINLGGSGQILANSSGTGIHFISFRSNAPCNPSCTSITGTALYNTQNLETIRVGGAVNLPGMLFQSYWGRVTIQGSGNIGAAAGQTVDMSGAGTITFGTILSSGARTWTVSSYQRVFEQDVGESET